MKLTPKQQALLDSLKKESSGSTTRVEILQDEFVTARSLERRGLITLLSIETPTRVYHEATLKKVPDQRSVTAQLQDLIPLANQNGLYDAADWVQTHLEAK